MQTHSITLRVNTLKASVDEVKRMCRSLFPHVSYEQVSWYADALILSDVTRHEVLASPLVKEGFVYPQSIPSMLPALVLNPPPDACVLDMCAAPGGKTTQLAALMRNRGVIFANDISRTRLFKLRSVASLLGATIITEHLGKGEFLWRTHKDSFDYVLLDAPCSMGMRRSAKEISALARRQTYLLRSASACVAPGGFIVYATCTDTQNENEGVIAWITQHVPELVPVGISLSCPQSWITNEGYIRVPREDFGEPFFVALLQRVASGLDS